MSSKTREDLLETKRAGDYIGHAESTMNRWRVEGSGPPFIKFGRRVFYRRSDLDTFLDSRIVQSTSEAEARRVGSRSRAPRRETPRASSLIRGEK